MACYPGLRRNFEFDVNIIFSTTIRVTLYTIRSQVQVVDTAALTQPQLSVFQVSMPMEGCSTISMDISPSNQCVAFG